MSEPTYYAEAEGLLKSWRQARDQSVNLGLSVADEQGDELALGELLDQLREHCSRHQIEKDYDWSAHDPLDWPYTPPLDVARRLLDADDNLFWKMPSGHHQSLLDAAFDRIDEMQTRSSGNDASYQSEAYRWCVRTFDEDYAADKSQRNARFLEEALELVQSLGMTRSDASRVLDFVFGRTAGEPAQELGGTMVTLAVLAEANGLDIPSAARTELDACWRRMDQIREKSKLKPKTGPPIGLCGNKEDHQPHLVETGSLAPFWCCADQEQRLPFRLERERS